MLKEDLPEEWQWVLEEVKNLLAQLAPESSRRWFELRRAMPERRTARDQPLSALDQLRYLLIRMSEHWDSYRTLGWQAGVPWTNHGTEQVIGRMKSLS